MLALLPASLQVYSQLEALFQEASRLRETVVRLLRVEAGPAALEDQHGDWLQNFVDFMMAGTELAERLHKAHSEHAKIQVRRILCALWNKQLDERRYMTDDCHPDTKIDDLTSYVVHLAHEIESRQERIMHVRDLLWQGEQQVLSSVAGGGDADVQNEEQTSLLQMYLSTKGDDNSVGSTETGERLQFVDEGFGAVEELMELVAKEAQQFQGLPEELRLVTGPADLCVGQYHQVVRDIATCMIRDEAVRKAREEALAPSSPPHP